jgi:hypothetical protein
MRTIILFEAIHQLLKTEKLLKERKLWYEIVPTPRELSSDCGSSLNIKLDQKELIELLLNEHGVKYSGINTI